MTLKSRFIGHAEKQEIATMHDAGHTLTEIVGMTGRHHSAVSAVLRAADLKRPFAPRNRILFTNDEMTLMRKLAKDGLSASEIAAQMPGRRKETINCKLQALGLDRSLALTREQREIILRMKSEGHTIREIAAVVGVGKSTVATVHTVEHFTSEAPLERRAIDGDVCRILTSSGKHEILVDAADFDLLPQTSIYLSNNGYPICRIKGVVTALHHIILGKPATGKVVDHINGNRKDCRRQNLRFATYSQNAQNSRFRGVGKSGLIGVMQTPSGKFYASVQIGLGTFDTAEDAARAYDAKAIELFGEFAMTNKSSGKLAP